jgi:hypothetical protein
LAIANGLSLPQKQVFAVQAHSRGPAIAFPITTHPLLEGFMLRRLVGGGTLAVLATLIG